MAQRHVYEAARPALLPVLVDNTRISHRLSAKLFRRFGIVSLIFGKPRVWDLFDLSSHTLRLPQTENERLRLEELIDLAHKSEDYLPVLIPCSPKARQFVLRHADALEPYFLLSEVEAIFSLPLLCNTEPSPHSHLTESN